MNVWNADYIRSVFYSNDSSGRILIKLLFVCFIVVLIVHRAYVGVMAAIFLAIAAYYAMNRLQEGFSFGGGGGGSGDYHISSNTDLDEMSKEFADKNFKSSKCVLLSGVAGISEFGSNVTYGDRTMETPESALTAVMDLPNVPSRTDPAFPALMFSYLNDTVCKTDAGFETTGIHDASGYYYAYETALSNLARDGSFYGRRSADVKAAALDGKRIYDGICSAKGEFKNNPAVFAEVMRFKQDKPCEEIETYNLMPDYVAGDQKLPKDLVKALYVLYNMYVSNNPQCIKRVGSANLDPLI